MGIWDWITSALMSGGQGRARSGRAEPHGPRHGGGVATLEAPDTSQDIPEGDRWWEPEGITQTEPLPCRIAELSTEARALENILVSQLDGHNLTLPPLPHVAERVLGQLGGRNYDVSKVCQVISEDQVTAAAVLRMANSALYRALNKITALQPAVSRLGAVAIRSLMMQQAMRAASMSIKGWARDFVDLIWHRSLVSAYVMQGLSSLTRTDANEAYLIGLMHDIGNVIVIRELERQTAHLNFRLDLRTFDYLCFECHQEFGELIAEEWQLPPSLKAIIANHHSEPAPDDPLRTQRLQLELSDMICAMIGYGPEARYHLLNSRPVQALGLADNTAFVRFLAELPENIREDIGFA